MRTIVTMLTGEEQDRLREMEDWIIKDEGTWVLAEGFNAFLGVLLILGKFYFVKTFSILPCVMNLIDKHITQICL